MQRARTRRALARAFRTGNLPESVWDDVEELITTQGWPRAINAETMEAGWKLMGTR